VFESGADPGLADVTPEGRARLDAIARWLQDVAYADVADAGLADRGAWVVRRMRLRVEAFPRFGERIGLSTFCSAISPLAAERRTSLSGGAARAEASALWVHLDPDSLRPARLDGDFFDVYGESAAGQKARSRLRHPGPPADAARSRWRFRFSDLDLAGHVNNAAYLEPAEERLAGRPDLEPLDLMVEYREPAPAGDATVLERGQWLWVEGLDGTVHASIGGLPE
jgi:acyl-ACP thioesterase